MYYKTTYNSPLGKILLCSDGTNLNGLWFFGQKYFGKSIEGNVSECNKLAIFLQTKKWLDDYFEGKRPEISKLPLAPIGNDFRQRVWQILCDIPYGKTMSYGDIAKILSKNRGGKMSAQAVGNAVGHNPVSIIIPCHRVVGSNGNLTGYAGGIDVKIKLLELEGVKITDFQVVH